MNTKQLQYVLTVAREGSFSKAADMLNISQPSLSQYIKKIEKEIGQELFDRTSGDVRITDAGKIYVESGRKILDIEHQMEGAFTDLSVHKTGSLIIGTAPYRAASMMPVIAAEFRKIHPGMHLVVREGTTAELTDGLEHGEYDLALTLLPVDQRLFNHDKIVEEEMVLVVPEAAEPFHETMMPGRKYPAVDIQVLDGQSLVMLTGGQFMQKQLDHLAADYHLEIYPAAIVKSLEAQIEMVKAGVGTAVMPSGIDRFCGKEVRFYSFVQELPRREVAVIWRKNQKLSGTLEELRNVIHSIAW